MTIMIASAKDGGSNSERDLMRACHLSGQIDADRAFQHYQANELPVTFEGAEPVEPTPWELILAGARWALLALAFVCTLLAAAGAFLTN